MSWNHRIFRDSDGFLSVRETHYDSNGEVRLWSTNPSAPIGYAADPETGEPAGDAEALLSLKWYLAKFQGACCFPILDEEKLLKMLNSKIPKKKVKSKKLKLAEKQPFGVV